MKEQENSDHQDQLVIWVWTADMRSIIGQVGFIVIDHQGGESRDRVVRDPCR